LVVVGLAAVGISMWAVVKDAWEPLLLLVPFFLLLPLQARRWSSESRVGNSLLSCGLSGLAFGLTGWINEAGGLHAVLSGLVFGGVFGLCTALMWNRRRAPKRGSRLESARTLDA
jgi:cyanate permease